MAIYNEILAPRFNRLASRLFSMKGAAPAKQLAGEIVISLPLFNGVENRHLEQWQRFAYSHFFAAVAAQNNAIQIRNPSGSNLIAVVEKIVVSTGTSQELTVYRNGANPADLTTVSQPQPLDSRHTVQSNTICSFQATTPGLGGFGAVWDQLALANTPYDVIGFEDQELVLNPGVAYLVTTNTVNSILSVSIIFRERAQEESETK